MKFYSSLKVNSLVNNIALAYIIQCIYKHIWFCFILFYVNGITLYMFIYNLLISFTWISFHVQMYRLTSFLYGPHRILFRFKLIYLFIYFWLHWVFVAAHGLSLVVASGDYSLLRCMGFSLRWLQLLWSTGSRRVGFSSCGTWAQ